MQLKTIALENESVQTLVWIKDSLVDFAKGLIFSLDNNEPDHLGYRLGFNFDGAIVSENGIYAVIYQKLGTKGLLLKRGQIVREINRSYYQSDMYEYPVAFYTASNGKVYLIHCPVAYNQLDFEDVETADIVTNIAGRKSPDFFHSRLEVSPNHKQLLSKGWVWHPCDRVIAFDLEACLKNPLLLDQPLEPPSIRYDVCSAGFIDDDWVLLGVSDDAEYFDKDESTVSIKKNQIAIWDLRNNIETQTLTIDIQIGHFIVVSESMVLDLYQYPKLINFKTGELIEQFSDVNSGMQRSSIIHHLNDLPLIAWNSQGKQLAISSGSTLQILKF